MATEMATMQFASTQSRGTDKTMEMTPECALRMSAANSQNVELNVELDDKSSQVCSDCQACHLLALAVPLQTVSKASFSVSFERPARHYFASADLQLSQKPPIFSA